jgi:general secretion pathway protein G
MLHHRHRRATARGFTLVELLIVVAIIGLLAGIALPNFRNARKRAQEAVLRENLWSLRHVIDQFYTDRGRYPSTLDELENEGYLRRIPIDPMTGTDDWIAETGQLGETPEDPEEEPGIVDVGSAAIGVALDGTPYSEF